MDRMKIETVLDKLMWGLLSLPVEARLTILARLPVAVWANSSEFRNVSESDFRKVIRAAFVEDHDDYQRDEACADFEMDAEYRRPPWIREN
jgi:hypothetical protein